MIWSSVQLLRESTAIFLERAPDDVDPEAIGRALVAEQDVVEVHDLHVWTVTSGFPALSAHVLVDARAPTATRLGGGSSGRSASVSASRTRRCRSTTPSRRRAGSPSAMRSRAARPSSVDSLRGCPAWRGSRRSSPARPAASARRLHRRSRPRAHASSAARGGSTASRRRSRRSSSTSPTPRAARRSSRRPSRS